MDASERIAKAASAVCRLPVYSLMTPIRYGATKVVVAARQRQSQPAHAPPPSFARWICLYTRARSSANRGADRVAS
jgi:hypothetical protein